MEVWAARKSEWKNKRKRWPQAAGWWRRSVAGSGGGGRQRPGLQSTVQATSHYPFSFSSLTATINPLRRRFGGKPERRRQHNTVCACMHVCVGVGVCVFVLFIFPTSQKPRRASRKTFLQTHIATFAISSSDTTRCTSGQGDPCSFCPEGRVTSSQPQTSNQFDPDAVKSKSPKAKYKNIN